MVSGTHIDIHFLFEIMHLTDQSIWPILGFKEIGHDDPAIQSQPSLLPRRRTGADHVRGNPLAVWSDLPALRKARHRCGTRRQKVDGTGLVLVLGMPPELHG